MTDPFAKLKKDYDALLAEGVVLNKALLNYDD